MNPWSLFFSVLLVGWISFSSYLFTCKYHQLCGSDSPPNETQANRNKDQSGITNPTPQAQGLEVFYQDKVWMSSPDNYAFQLSSPQALGTPSLQNIEDSLGQFLKENPNTKLRITGLYLASEDKPTDFANMGLARASQFREQLDQDLAADRFELQAALQPNLVRMDSGKVSGALQLEIVDQMQEEEQPKEASTSGLSADELAKLEKGQLVYFAYNSNLPIMNQELRTYLNLLKKYTDTQTSARISVIGYADSVGTEPRNQELSQQRAEQVRAILLRQQIDARQISIQAQGEKNPQADNGTPQGREKNRRVEIKVQK